MGAVGMEVAQAVGDGLQSFQRQVVLITYHTVLSWPAGSLITLVG